MSGLSSAEAAARLRTEGGNELPGTGRRSLLRIAAEVAREPMFLLLLAAGALYLALGEPADAAILLLFATASVSITIVQESRSERVLETLRDLSSPRALVERDGRLQRIPGREVVRGDLMVIAEGDRIAADAYLIESHDLAVDESLLTGEAVAARKRAGAANAPDGVRPGGDDLPYVFSGTLVVRGQGKGVVVATGPQSEIGRIGRSLAAIEIEAPRLRAETRRLVVIFGALGFVVSAMAVLIYGFASGRWLEAALGGIAIGMSMLPEEFPLVLSVFMAMGAWRISKARVLTRRSAAIETLGAATVLCTDKTGTLTENRMSAVLLAADGLDWERKAGRTDVPDGLCDLLDIAVLASAPESHDPMDRAIHALAAEQTARPARAAPGSLIRRYGLRPGMAAVANVWQGDDRPIVAAKGAPETIAALCGFDERRRGILNRAVAAHAGTGIRLLAVARAAAPDAGLPDSQAGFAFSFLGLVGFADPLRATVPQAIRECRSAGIRVLMITGDHPTTAAAVAAQAGLDVEEVISGAVLAALTDEELDLHLRRATVFARVLPEQKLRIVEALKRLGEVVAMTGDGVNDAPALKAAHIGIAMGGRGTDVAREAASIVLLDDDFGSIVRAIRLGRRIYDNLRKAMAYIVAVHVPIAGLALLPVVFGLPLLLTPMLIALLEMVIDPACSVVFEAEPEEPDVMARRPRDPHEAAIGGSVLLWSLAQGLMALLAVAAVTASMALQARPVEEIRAVAFVALVAVNFALIFTNRTLGGSLWRAVAHGNPALWLGLPLVGGLLAAALLWQPARTLLRFGDPATGDLLMAGAAGLALLAMLVMVRGAGSSGRESRT
jgi:P-type Ca2+ transporter type 2C